MGGFVISIALPASAAPVNDNFPGTTITGSSGTVSSASNVDATGEAGEPTNAGSSSTVSNHRSVWYSWTAPSTGIAQFNTCGFGLPTSFDSTLGVYTGSAVGSLTKIAENDNHARCGVGGTASLLSFPATSGTTYRVMVDGASTGAAGATGQFFLNWLTISNDAFPGSTISGSFGSQGRVSNAGTSGEAGEPTNSGSSTTTSSHRSVWYSWTAPSTGRAVFDTCGDPSFAQFDTTIGVYTGSAVDALVKVADNNDAPDCANGNGSVVPFAASSGTTYRIMVDGVDVSGTDASGMFSLEWRVILNDDFPGTTLTGPSNGSILAFQSSFGASGQTGEPTNTGSSTTISNHRSIWYSWTAPADGRATFDTCVNTGFNSTIGIYTGTSVEALTKVAENDDSPFPSLCPNTAAGNSLVTFTATAGTTYRILIDGVPTANGVNAAGHTWPQWRFITNDDFAQALPLLFSVGTHGFAADNIVASSEPGEPPSRTTPSVNGPNRTVWVKWTAPADGQMTMDLCEPANTFFDSLISVYTGSSLSTLTRVAENDNATGCGLDGLHSRVTFAATTGTTYHAQIDGVDGNFVNANLRLAFVPANDNFANAQVINGASGSVTGTNEGSTGETGEPTNEGSTSTVSNHRSVWYTWVAPQSGLVRFDTCSQGSDTTLGAYTGSAVDGLTLVATNNDSPVCSNGFLSAVTFDVSAGTTYRLLVDGTPFNGIDRTGPFTLSWVYPPPNDHFANAEVIEGTTGSVAGSTADATGETGEPTNGGSSSVLSRKRSVWYAWTAPTSGTATFDTCTAPGSLPYDTTLGVWTGSGFPLTFVTSNDNDSTSCPSGSQRSKVSFGASAGTTYRIQVDGAFGAFSAPNASGNFVLSWDFVPTISINDVTANEGTSGTTSFSFTVSLSQSSSSTSSVNYATANGSATTADGDYTSVGTTALTFTPGQTSKTVTVNVTGDNKHEPTETFFVNLSNPSGATIADGQGVGTITNDDAQPTISVGDVSANEGTSGFTGFLFPVTLSNPSYQDVIFSLSTANGTAAAGDYQSLSGSLLIPAGQTSYPGGVQVFVNGDTTFEANETFFFNVPSATNATIADGQGTGTILNDDPAPTLSISDVTASEGNSGSSAFTFTVTKTGSTAVNATVNYATADATATAGSDYTPASGILTFTPADTSKTIVVPVIGDTTVEPNETFSVTLSSPSSASISDGLGIGTIQNDDVPTVSINDVAANEGNFTGSTFSFTVTMSQASTSNVTVDYATADGTAATADGDYHAVPTTALTFSPGQLSKTVFVSVDGDTKFESNETFFVNLSNASGATIADGQGVGTILNDDAAPMVSVNDIVLNEGDAANPFPPVVTPFTFSVSLSAPSAQTTTVNYSTLNGTATTADSDYQFASNVVTFPPGVTSQTITINVIRDVKYEPNETFLVNLSGASGATLGDAQGQGTILNDDPAPSLSINNVTANEGDPPGATSFTFTVTRTGASSLGSTVSYATSDGTASAGSDYGAANGVVSFGPGVTSQTITVLVSPDTAFEANETFFVDLSTAVDATISDGQGQGTIVNDDAQPTVSIGDVTMDEGDSGLTSFLIEVSLSNPSTETVNVDYFTRGDTAFPDDVPPHLKDYTDASGTLTFSPGVTSQSITVDVVGDVRPELDETFFVNLFNPVNTTLSDDEGLGTIVNDDEGPLLSIDDVSTSEGDSGTTAFTFTVSKSEATQQTVTVDYATADETAIAGSDYMGTSGTLTLGSDEASKTVTVTVNGDTTVEADETFSVTLSNPTNAGILDAVGTGTIQNDDLSAISIDDVSAVEGNSGTTDLTFTVSLSQAPPTGIVSVNYATADGTATGGEDYTSQIGLLTFEAPNTTRTITVRVNGDTAVEPDETFSVSLFATSANATIADDSGLGTIQDDDSQASFAIDDVSANEGNSGTTAFTFTVTKTGTTGQTTTVDYATAAATATAGSDYTSGSGTLTFSPAETSKTITVNVTGDTAVEPEETFAVSLSNASGASISDGFGIGTIQNDDLPTLSISNDFAVNEGNGPAFTAVHFTVTMSQASPSTVTVDFTPALGTASENDVGLPAPGTLTFSPGQTQRSITAIVIGDTVHEADETFFMNLSNPVGATITDGQAVATILNDDAPPPVTLAVDDVTATEGDSGTTAFTFTVTKTGSTGQTVTVDYATADGTATTADSDYGSASGTLTFAPGDATKTITVDVAGDAIEELDETFTVDLSNPANATILDDQGLGTIQNDDFTTADLALTIDDDLDPVTVGQDLTYTIEVTNNGPAAATDTVMAARLPNKTDFVSVSSSQGTCGYFPRRQAVGCRLGTLSSGQTVTVTIVVTPTEVPANPLTMAAGVQSATIDPITTNDRARETTAVVP